MRWLQEKRCMTEPKNKQIQILRTIVGSTAHGLANENSDIDYRGVFVVPTSELLGIGGTTQQTSWIEGQIDDTSWEIGHFLKMATKCNPTVLEVFLAPYVDDGTLDKYGQGATKPIGKELRNLFPYVWNSVDVLNAFRGYGHNQQKKFLHEKDTRPHKYAVAYLRTLYQGWELLSTGTFTVRVADTEIGETLKRWKNKEYTVGEVMQVTYEWQKKLEEAFEKSPKKETDMRPVNDYLLRVRREFWL